MSLNQFEELGKKILASKLHLDVPDNTSVIDRDLVNEYQNYTLQSLQDVKSRDFFNEIESPKEIDVRVKKFDELENRLLAAICDLKKQSKLTDEQCMLHKRSEEPLSDGYLKTFLENVHVPMDIERIVMKDTTAIEENASNIGKAKKLCEDLMIKDMEKKHSSLSTDALQVADQVTTLLTEMDDDIDCLSSAKNMYVGLSTSSDHRVNSNLNQLKKLKDIL